MQLRSRRPRQTRIAAPEPRRHADTRDPTLLWVVDLNRYYRDEPGLYEQDFSYHGRPHSVSLTLPPLGVVFLTHKGE